MTGVGNFHHYLCSYCNQIFEAAEHSIDRTREVRCPGCAGATVACWSDDEIDQRLRGMTA